MQYQIGPLSMDHIPYAVDQANRVNTAGIAIKPVVGTVQPGEWVGPGEDTLQISGILWPHHQGGKTEIEIAHALVNGAPQFVLRGDLRPMGWFQITRVRQDDTYVERDGVGKKIVLTIAMRRAKKPGILELIGTLIAMFA